MIDPILHSNIYHYENINQNYRSIENRRYFNPISPCELDHYKLLHYNNKTAYFFDVLIQEHLRNNDIILIEEYNKDNNMNMNMNKKEKSIIKISKNRMVRGYYSIQNISYTLFEKEHNYFLDNHLIRIGDITKKNITDSFYYKIDNKKIKKYMIWILTKKKMDIGIILYIWNFIYQKSSDLFLLQNIYGRSIRNRLHLVMEL